MTNKMRKAKVSVQYNGLLLVIPKDNQTAFLLFLEWLATFPPSKIPIHAIIDSESAIKIRLLLTRECYDSAAKYINENS